MNWQRIVAAMQLSQGIMPVILMASIASWMHGKRLDLRLAGSEASYKGEFCFLSFEQGVHRYALLFIWMGSYFVLDYEPPLFCSLLVLYLPPLSRIIKKIDAIILP